MFIQTEETPNPNTLKFIPGVQVLKEGTIEFKDKDSAKFSNLANIDPYVYACGYSTFSV